MMIIKIKPESSGQHLFQSQSHRPECWIDGHIAVPEALETKVYDCMGYCDLIVEGNVLKDIEPRPELIPIEEADTTPTALEQLRADVDYISVMTGVEL